MTELIHRVAVEKQTFRVTDDYAVCEDADVILIDVQTPTDSGHVPHYESLREVSGLAGQRMRPGTLVIIESTVAPGTWSSRSWNGNPGLRGGRAGAVARRKRRDGRKGKPARPFFLLNRRVVIQCPALK